jgi:3-dehydroquinate synthase
LTTLQLSNYKIEIASLDQICAGLNAWLRAKSWSKVFVLLDENTERDCLPLLERALWPEDRVLIKINSGEENKNIYTCQSIWQQMVSGGGDRHSLLVNLGGGVIGDMGGFAASTYMRGISFLNIPTTLLAQVDASVGGKLGVDFNGLKNMIGMFNDPVAVLLCPEFFYTLPEEQLRSGFAEVLKHALIKDESEFEFLEGQDPLQIPEWTEIVARSVAIKKEIVQEDPFEKGVRKILNFGHTLGHAVETESFKTSSPLMHGEAIGIGMLCESWISANTKRISNKTLDQIADAIKAAFPYCDIRGLAKDQIMGHMLHDKKNVSGSIRFSLLSGIGSCETDCQVQTELITESLEYYHSVYA